MPYVPLGTKETKKNKTLKTEIRCSLYIEFKAINLYIFLIEKGKLFLQAIFALQKTLSAPLTNHSHFTFRSKCCLRNQKKNLPFPNRCS